MSASLPVYSVDERRQEKEARLKSGVASDVIRRENGMFSGLKDVRVSIVNRRVQVKA